MLRREGGFTLVELMVVIAIIALLAAILFPNLTAAIQKGRVAAVVSGARNLYTLLTTYYADHGEYPIVDNGGSYDFDSTWKSSVNFNQKWPWGGGSLLDQAKIVDDGDTSTPINQSAIIYFDLSSTAAKKVAEEMATATCASNITGKPAVVIDLRPTASEAVYICK